MRRFIEAMVGVDGLDIGYGDYNTLFVKREYDSYYYFFFLEEKEQLSNLQSEAEDIFYKMKESKILENKIASEGEKLLALSEGTSKDIQNSIDGIYEKYLNKVLAAIQHSLRDRVTEARYKKEEFKDIT